MSESLPKIAAFIFFIWLGWFLRRRGILKESAFHAVSGLVLYVTIPCIIITNLNGIKIEGIMLLIVFLGFLSNVAMLGYAWFLTRKETDEKSATFGASICAATQSVRWLCRTSRRFIRPPV